MFSLWPLKEHADEFLLDLHVTILYDGLLKEMQVLELWLSW